MTVLISTLSLVMLVYTGTAGIDAVVGRSAKAVSSMQVADEAGSAETAQTSPPGNQRRE